MVSQIVVAQTPFQVKIKPEITIQRTSSPIIVDGVLDETAWITSAIATGFTETFPDDQVRPPYDTEVRILYDDDYLYLGFKAFDDPTTVRSALRDRDAIFADDFVGIILDTYGDGNWAYEFFFNPRGIQGDMRLTRDNEDASFNVVHYSEGQMANDGYVVEVAIPFSELRFPDRFDQEWNVTFWRVRPRSSRERSSWATISRDDPCFLCQLGTMKGIQGVKPGRQLRLLPSLTTTQSAQRFTADQNLNNERIQVQPSLGVSYAITSSLTTELTLNPDFSQIESDAGQIDVNTTTALYFSERRPFFQEGSDLFASSIQQLYTRSINAPSAAVKVIARSNRSSFAYLGALDDQSPVIIPLEESSRFLLRKSSWVNVARYKQTFGNDNNIGLILTDRRYEGSGSGTTIGIDGRLRISRTLSASYHAILTQTDEGDDEQSKAILGDETFSNGAYTMALDGESFGGTGLQMEVTQDGRHVKSTFRYSQLSPDFRVHAGFVNQNSNRNITNSSTIVFYPKTKLIDEMSIRHIAGLFYNWDGVLKDKFSMPSINFSLPGQTGVQIGYLWSTERYVGVRIPSIQRWDFNIRTNFSSMMSSGFSITKGKYIARFTRPAILGEGHELHYFINFQPTSQFEFRPSIAWQELNNPMTDTELFSVYILRSRMSYQFTRELFLRVITEYNHGNGNVDIQPLVTYKINPFSVFYLGTNRMYSDWNGMSKTSLQSRQYFLKAQYLF